MTTNTDVYATDFYAWCLTTAALVREGQWDEIDPKALAEELESLGRSQKRELESRLEVLVMHLLKWQYQPLRRVDSHSWYDTILEQRNQLQRLLRDNPSLRPQVPALLLEVYPDARERAQGHMRPSVQIGLRESQGQLEPRGQADLSEGPIRPLPLACPWTDVQILDKNFWPGP